MVLAPPLWCVHANVKLGKGLPRGSVVSNSHVLYNGNVRCVHKFETVLPTLLEDADDPKPLCCNTTELSYHVDVIEKM